MDVLDRMVDPFKLLSPDQAHRLRDAQNPIQCRGRQREQEAIVDARVSVGVFVCMQRNYVRYG